MNEPAKTDLISRFNPRLFLVDTIRQIGIEAIIMFVIIVLDITFFFAKDAIFAGFITDTKSYVSDILQTAFHLTLTYVIIGYGIAIFLFRSVIKPYFWKLFLLSESKISRFELATIQTFLLSVIIVAIEEIRPGFSFLFDDFGDRYTQLVFTKHSFLEVIIISVSILAIFTIILVYRKSRYANWKMVLIGLLFIAGMSLPNLAPSFRRTYAEALQVSSESVKLYYSDYIALEAEEDFGDPGYKDRYMSYINKSKILELREEALYKEALGLARTDEEAAVVAYDLSEYYFTWTSYSLANSLSLVSYMLDDTGPDINLRMAKTAIEQGDYENGAKFANACIREAYQLLNPTRCYVELIWAHWHAGDTEGALAASRLLSRDYPKWPDAIWWEKAMTVLPHIYRLTYPQVVENGKERDRLCSSYKAEGPNAEACLILDVKRIWGMLAYDPAELAFTRLFAAFPNSIEGHKLLKQMREERKMLEAVYTKSINRGFLYSQDIYRELYQEAH